MMLESAVKLVIMAMDLSKGGETFVYKNPSFYVKDLISAMNPVGDYAVTGVREGEKLHECMITSADSRRTYEYDDYYVIYPNYDWWVSSEDTVIAGGAPVAPEWEYSSEKNEQWLGVDDLTRLLPQVQDGMH
jgi:FlaA1/EpsC-like NDP-sugar epimerase